MTLDDIRMTSDNKLAGIILFLLAVLFLMTGAMKLLIPMLADAWSGQLLAANVPLYTVSRWAVPFLEMKGERETLDKWAKNKGDDGIADHWQEKNQSSLDGKPTHILTD